jgi:hypothetical protein
MQYWRSSSSLVDGVLVGRGDLGLAVRVVVRVGVGVFRSVVRDAVGLCVGRSVACRVGCRVGRSVCSLGRATVGGGAGVVGGTAGVVELTGVAGDAEAQSVNFTAAASSGSPLNRPIADTAQMFTPSSTSSAADPAYTARLGGAPYRPIGPRTG